MNVERLSVAENDFLRSYPGGFLHPEMQAVAKKHKVNKMVEFTQASFAKSEFDDVRSVANAMIKVVSRSSMVSVFEKPKFRDCVNALPPQELAQLVESLRLQLHSRSKKKREQGFNMMLDILRFYKLAKWTLMTVIPNYYFPQDEVFVKPTTAKGVIKTFEITNCVYKPQPTWDFYNLYKQEILAMKALVDQDLLAPNNAAFCGFLMMNINKD